MRAHVRMRVHMRMPLHMPQAQAAAAAARAGVPGARACGRQMRRRAGSGVRGAPWQCARAVVQHAAAIMRIAVTVCQAQ